MKIRQSCVVEAQLKRRTTWAQEKIKTLSVDLNNLLVRQEGFCEAW